MPARANQLKSYPFAFRLFSVFLAWSMVVPNAPAKNFRLRSEISAPYGMPAPRVPEARAEFAPTPPQNPPRGIGECADVSKQTSETVPPRNKQADEWGEITVAQPKIWQFERVSSLLDGLLRDVEGVSLSDLTQLNPNAQNAAAVKFVQSALEVGVQYDQAAVVNNQNTLANYQAIRNSQLQQLDSYNAYMRTLEGERDRVAAQYMAATNEVNTLNALKAAGPLTAAQNKELEEATSRQASAQSSLTSVNSLISGAGPAPTLTNPPTVTGTTVQQPASGSSMGSTLSSFADVLKSLPTGVQNSLNSALGSPSYPATKQLDNFITLLYERLAREVSVLQDDLTRDPENEAFLLQFDVGLYPSKKAADHVARVEFDLDCPGCKVYSLYPGQSAYNLANYSGASKRNTFWGNVATLIGFGLSASYRRQVDTLEGSLVQSVYTAGFQNGVLVGSSTPDFSHAPSARQSFGWYYGAAPFEKLVSPGIRSTFALVTVPRRLIEDTHDPEQFENVNACVSFQINGAWASRNDPLAQDSYFSALESAGRGIAAPAYVPRRDVLFNEFCKDAENQSCQVASKKKEAVQSIAPCKLNEKCTRLLMNTFVKLPVAADDVPFVARREGQKLHVIRLEYNTVYQSADSPASPTLVSSSASTTTSTSSAAPTAGSTTSSTTVTTSTSSPTVAPASSSVPASNNPYDVLPCPKGKCSGMLIRLDHPIDPNLVVTVNGKPLKRVRDWRGRGTSILPPAQSGSDLSAQASAAGSINLRQLQIGRSLLESDQFEPNSWYPANSHDLLLNIAQELTTDYEFPVIRLTDPKGSAIIPYDLRQNITELTINGFHLKPRTNREIAIETSRQLRIAPGGPVPSLRESKILSYGPYPYSTFLPLFSKEPASKRLYAYVGETGEDLLIGFLGSGTGIVNCPRVDELRCVSLLETHTQVILEDRNLDFAWSLSCVVQGDQLACELPRKAIGAAYEAARDACVALPSKHDSNEKYDPLEPVDCPSFPTTTIDSYTAGLQVWVEQSDPEGKEDFYSPEPVSLGPLFWEDSFYCHHDYRPWHFLSASPKFVKIEACSYFVDPNKELKLDAQDRIIVDPVLSDPKDIDITVLTAPEYPIHEASTVRDPGSLDRCTYFSVPTNFLLGPQVAFRIDGVNATITVPSERLRPAFGSPRISSTNAPADKSWDVDFPVKRGICSDIDSLRRQVKGSGIQANWWSGTSEIGACPSDDAWTSDDKNSQIHLKLHIPKSALGSLPERLRLIRDSGGAGVEVATLADLRKLLLPEKLKLEALSDSQFVLSGEHAGVIDAVAVQNGEKSWTFAAASGADFALVTAMVTAPPKAPAPAPKPNSPAPPTAKTQKPGTNPRPSPPAQNQQPNTKPTSSSRKWRAADGRQYVPAAYRFSSQSPAPAKPKSNNSPAATAGGIKPGAGAVSNPQARKPPAAKSPDKNSKAMQALDPGTYTVIPLVYLGEDPKTKNKIYMPLDVTDTSGKPLLFTVPEPKKPADDSQNQDDSSSKPCAAPCFFLPCAAGCAPSAPKPKTP